MNELEQRVEERTAHLNRRIEQLERRVSERTTALERANQRLQQEITERQKIEDALNHQQAFFQTVLDTNPNLIFVKDREGKYLLANQAFLNYYGLTAAEVLGKTVAQINSNSADVELFTAQDREVFATQQPQFNPEYACHLPTGEACWYQSIKKPFASEHGQNTHLLGVCVDITRRKRMEEALRESEARYRLLIERMNEGLVINDRNDEITYVNPKLGEILGYSPAELVGHRWSEFLDELNRRIVDEQMAKRRRGESSTYTLEPRRKDGRALSVIVSATPIFDRDGSFEGSFGVVTDVTALKAVESELQQAKAQLQAVLDAIPGSVSWMDARGRYIGVNQHLAATLDVSPDTFVGQELGFQHNSSEFVEFMGQFLASPTQTDRKIVEVGVGETKRNYLIAAQKYAQGEMAVSVGIDITERKQAEEKLRQNEEQLNLALDVARMGYWDWNLVTGELTWSHQLQQLCGFAPNTFDGSYEAFLSCIHPDDRDRVQQSVQDHLTCGKNCQLEFRIVLPDGRVRWLEGKGRLYYNEAGVPVRMTGIDIDITERKQAQVALQAQTEFLQTVLDTNPNLIWVKHRDGRVMLANQACAEFFGISVDRMLGKAHRELTQETEVEYCATQDEKVLATLQEKFIPEEEFVSASGEKRWFQTIKKPLLGSNGEADRIFGVATDITARKQAEEKLRQREEQLNLALDAACMGYWDWKLETGEVTWSYQLEQIFGLAPNTFDGSYETFYNYLYPDDRDRVRETVQDYLASGEDLQLEFRIVLPDGRVRWLEGKGRLYYNETGTPVRMTGINLDITDRKQAQVALQAQTEFLQTVLDTNPSLIYVKDREGKFVLVNQGFADFYGLLPEAIVGQTNPQLHPYPVEVERFLAQDAEVLRTAEPKFIIEELIHSPTGAAHWFQTTKIPVLDEKGQIAQILGVSTDITERKHTEEQLRQSEERLRLALEAARMGFWDRNLQIRQGIWSNNLERLYGLVPNTYDGTYETFLAKIHPDDRNRVIEANEASLRTGGQCDLEFRVVWSDGSIHWIQSQSQVFYDKMGKPVRSSGIDVDISDRKQAQLQIQASLREKEVLLQEIHHRVKNNLQIICSLLDLQAQQLEEPTLLEMFRESQHRVRSMALVHEKLYQSQDCAKINFSEYIESLTSYLFQAYAVDAANVALRLDIDKVVLDIDTAIPCGLIINELVSNALKHAFSKDADGAIYVALKARTERDFLLMVRDNGRGLPDHFDLNKVRSLGLQLVKVLTKQLEGMLEIDGENGAEFCIRFAKF